MEPTKEFLDGFATAQRLLRASRPVQYEVTPDYFKIHLPDNPGWSVCRLIDFGGSHPSVLVPLSAEMVTNLVPLLEATPLGPRWSRIALMTSHDMRVIGPALCAAWDASSDASAAGGQQEEPTA
jgi:predicted type IV restriction endonuclease